jgi:hypothetical protein
MKYLMFFLIVILLNANVLGQKVLINEKRIQFKTYPFSDPNPVPEFGKIFPYFRFDGFAVNGVMRDWKMIEMENDYIKLWVAPEIGGKIWRAVEKSTGKEFIYYNHVVKFRDIAMRGAWTSGGIEVDFGIQGHAPTTATPVDYFIRKNDDGSVSCFVGAIDLASRTRWSVEINLQKDKAYFTTRSRWDNPTGLEQSYYHWMDLGVKADGNLEYIFPGNYFIGHNGEYSNWPIDTTGRDLSVYKKNNFGGSKSYHVFGEITDFYGAYWHDDDFGFAHYSPYDEKPGKKIFVLGLSDQGTVWGNLLTDTDGQLTEIQSGRMFNQASSGSTYTPFKHRGFAPGSTDEWTEYWFPVKETQGLKNALPIGSVNLQQKDNMVSLWFCPNEIINGNLQVRNGKEVVFTKEIHSNPMQSIKESFEYRGNYKNLSVWLGNNLLFNADREKYQVKRQVDMPSGFNWETVYGHYLKGKEWERQRSYNLAEAEYQKALEIDSWFVPALTGMANLAYRKTDFRSSMEYSLKALSVDTYNADANMIYGLSGMALGDTTSAIDGFSIASADISQRCAAYSSLASIFVNQGDFRKALNYAEKSLLNNRLGSDAIQLKILCLRKLGIQNEANDELGKLEAKDPLNHFIRFEKYFAYPSSENKILAQKFVTNEFPQETYLEYALWYFHNGQIPEALKILELAPENHPVVLLWEGYLNHLTGKEQAASNALTDALKINPKFVLPFRIETLVPLEWAQTLSRDWKIKYYAGLIYLSVGAVEKGKTLWENCNAEPDFYPFYIARSRLSDAGSQQAQADVDKALEVSGSDWQAGWLASKYYMNRGNIQKAEELAKNYYLKYPENFNLGLQYARMLELDKKYAACISLLKNIQLLPGESASKGSGPTPWRRANVELAKDLMKAGKYRKALENIDMARQWPANFRVGKPYFVNERTEDSLALECYKKLKDEKSIRMMQDKMNNNPR